MRKAKWGLYKLCKIRDDCGSGSDRRDLIEADAQAICDLPTQCEVIANLNALREQKYCYSSSNDTAAEDDCLALVD